MANRTSQHILSTAANLLRFCLIVITSLHISNKSETTVIDEVTSISALLLVVSCILSFQSIRTEDNIWQKKLEAVADYLFLIALFGILFDLLYVLFNLSKW